MPDIPQIEFGSPESALPTFMSCTMTRDFDADDINVVISGIPCDQTTTGRPGARFGPAGIRKASAHLAWELRRRPWDFSVFDVLGVVDGGVLAEDKNKI